MVFSMSTEKTDTAKQDRRAKVPWRTKTVRSIYPERRSKDDRRKDEDLDEKSEKAEDR